MLKAPDEYSVAELAALDLDPAFPLHLAAEIKLLVLDVDGVLTDGGLYYGEAGLGWKRFDAQDGFGIKLAGRVGIETALISGMESPALRKRAADLGITECRGGEFRKGPILLEIMQERALKRENVACMGDDLIDLPMLRLAGLALTVANAQPELKRCAHYVSPLGGGQGAVRQVLRHILAARGVLAGALDFFLRPEAKTAPAAGGQ